MIDDSIIKLASNTSNFGLQNKYSHKISLKNNLCGDKIAIEIIANNNCCQFISYLCKCDKRIKTLSA